MKFRVEAPAMAHHPPPPPYDPYYVPQPLPDNYLYSAGGGGINTLFVSGLPDDVKAREIHNLFRRRPGFESCQLKYTGRGNQVFICFLICISFSIFLLAGGRLDVLSFNS